MLATAWVFTRSAPVTGGRPVTIRLAHWQIKAGPPDGIAAGRSYYLGMSARSAAFERQLHRLVGPQGSVDKFVAALALSAPAAAREDTLIEVRNCLAAARPQDIRLAAAAAVLARLAPAADEREKSLVQRSRLESSQTQGEGQLLQMELLLRRTEKL